MVVSLIAGAGLLLTGTPLAAAAPADDTPHTNIVGGDDPTENYPFIVAFLNPHPKTGKTVAYCGGALLAPNWIVSAGHCGMDFTEGVTQARVGSNRWAEGGTLANITDIVQYPAWDYNTPGNDLTMIRLDRNVTEQPIKLARTPGKVGTKERLLGYGATCDPGSPEWPCYPAGLQQATLRLVPDSGCHWYDKSVELCAAGDNGQSACFADSGGPLMRPHTVYDRKGTKKTEWLLVGDVSRDGDADADTNPTCTGSTDVFTDVTKFADWINRTISRDGYKLNQSQEAYELAG